MRDLIGRTLGHYRVVEQIGEGGMGVVYRAHDERLDRDVAVKVLPEEVAASADRLARFEREAKAVARLDHPNILAIHDLGSEGGVTYAVMELLEGESLRELIARGGLTTGMAVGYARAIADGLAAAHDKGILHRDLKPENVFLTQDGRIKVLDFGLAKLQQPEALLTTETPTATLDTAPGGVLGTVAYMAPEQLQGRPVDQRSDIFALGAVLYEMLTGHRPFGGGTTAEVAAGILERDPDPIPDPVPTALATVVSKCLSKRPETRFSSAHDLSLTLGTIDSTTVRQAREKSFLERRWPHLAAVVIAAIIALLFVLPPESLFDRSGEPPPETPPEAAVPRLVVLPFENLGDPEDEYFADGITEELISRLAVVSGLQVISRTSAMYYKGKNVPLRQIGEELDVGYVLEGTIRWDHGEGEHGRVRITPQLIHVADDSSLWSEQFDRALEGIFEIQSDIAERVVARLELHLLGSSRLPQLSTPTESMSAYQAYLKGLQYLWHQESLEVAVAMLRRAVEMDPEFALAYAALCEAHSGLYHFRIDYTAQRLERAKASADRALALAPGLPEGHLALAVFHYRGHRDYQQALAELFLAADGLPNDPRVLNGLFAVLRRMGRWDESVDALEKWQRADPRSQACAIEFAYTLTYMREYAAAEEHMMRAIAIAPEMRSSYYPWLYVLWDGNTKRARHLLRSAPDDFVARYEYRSTLFDFYDRDPTAVLAKLGGLAEDAFRTQNHIVPTAFIECRALRMEQEFRAADSACTRSIELLEREIEARPHDPRVYSALGQSLALLGRNEEAVAAGRRAVELAPKSEDVIEWSERAIELAMILARVGRDREALDLIDQLLSVPCELSAGLLCLDPVWDPLRDHPRFQEILEKHDTE